MKNQEKTSFSDERRDDRDHKLRISRNREKSLYQFSTIPEGKSQRMTQNNINRK